MSDSTVSTTTTTTTQPPLETVSGGGDFPQAELIEPAAKSGEFEDGFITGRGEMILPDLSKYQGQFCQGTFHGNGVLNLMSTSLYYYGNWKNGKKHGKGWILYEPGDWYDGDWSNNLRDGIGYRRYKNGAKYKGEWKANKKEGKGKILLENNDYYTGEWFDDKPHGYGEYTWGLVHNEVFCFPLYNSYRGSWKNGMRDGVGIMNFGTECGAKYAGIWSENNKHGPGVMICGNGLILESNPLFEFNKPVHKNSLQSITDFYLDNPDCDMCEPKTEKGSYYEILKMVNTKKSYSQLSDDMLINITQNSQNIPRFMFVKLLDSISGSKRIWCPLEIPTHTIAEEVNFNYFIDFVFNFDSKFGDILAQLDTSVGDFKNEGARFKISTTNHKFSTITLGMYHPLTQSSHVTDPLTCTPRDQQRENTPSDENVLSYNEKLEMAKLEEAEHFRNIILIHLPKLYVIYNRYALLCDTELPDRPKKHNIKPVMVRLFLWQMFRDAHVQNGVQLAQVDSFLWRNPHSCLDTEYYPFEPIYFYQFLQYLMGCACLIYLKKLEKSPDMKIMLPSNIFKEFLELHFFEDLQSSNGTALGENLNLVPIKKMYKLYASISEPMSVKTFFCATFRNETDKLPCFAAISLGPTPKVIDGNNIVPVGHEIYYVQIPEPVVSQNDLNLEKIENEDHFSRSLLTLRTLGKKRLTECLTKVCPRIVNESKLDMNYNLTFLEFYEVIIMCAFLKAEDLVKEHEAKILLAPKLSTTDSHAHLTESLSKRSASNKKKKFKKSTIGLGVLTSA